MKSITTFIFILTLILNEGCKSKLTSNSIEKKQDMPLSEEIIKMQLLADAKKNRKDKQVSVHPLLIENTSSVLLIDIEPVLLEKSYEIRRMQFIINQFNEPNSKDSELEIKKENIIKKYNIDLKICYFHNKLMEMSVMKYFDTPEFHKKMHSRKFLETYSLAHKKLFPFSNEPIYSYPVHCGVGFEFTPREISMYSCEECNSSRGDWIKKNVN